ncbi:hypothetical protein [Pantoea ananatis]|uniref:hypothetical protein n=1 Tax=Pantoea ananas TaxID=553 RepID=UPI001C897F63|nr:hypothetical protein [Pantoea ananatis]MCW0350686.1 hypothetical protein [Pantoea ananatis]QZE31405.1 hypothetical protein K4732_20845 [Pantoea ananatis]
MAEELKRPEVQKPAQDTSSKDTRLSNVRTRRNRTTSETPKTVRLTAEEKVMCAKLTEAVQDLAPSKTITDSTIMRAALYLANQSGPEKLIKMIKDYL